MAAFSFNGNKIITTSGGGMLVSHDERFVIEARRLASQARDPAPHYQHSVVGYNYRLSNILAAVGRAQLLVLQDRVAARRANFEAYVAALAGLPGLAFMPEEPNGRSNCWLTCITVDPSRFGASREDIRRALDAENIEARPIWKPLHLQPVFSHCERCGGGVAEEVFDRGLCLPSGSSLLADDLVRITDVVRRCANRACPSSA
jgi:pyridoxal phosphate-dependent aminotransferase EpsN